MPKKKLSSCAQDAIFAGVEVLPEDAKALAIPYLQKFLGDFIDPSQKEYLKKLETIGVTAAEVGKAIKTTASKKEKFESLGRLAATDKGTKMGVREVKLEDLVSHFTLAPAQSRIVALTRGKYTKIDDRAINDFISRLSASEAAIRATGIPIVINKVAAATVAGPMHYSFLALGDIGRVFASTGNLEVFGKALLNSAEAQKNIQFQNLAEAARRILEEAEIKPETLKGSVREALTSRTGAPVGQAKKLSDEAMKWANSPEGSAIVDQLVETMTSPNFIKKLVAEDTNLASITIALSKADGWQLAAKTLETVSELKAFGERMAGYGQLLLNNGINKIFGKDALAKLTPEQLNVAFAQNATALFFSHLDDASLAAIKEMSRKARGAKKDAAARKATGTPSRTNLNKANKEAAQEERIQIEKIVADEMDNDVTIRNMESSLEAASIARQLYLENHYGTMVGGLTKLVSKVSNLSTMGSRMKTMLIGAEHLRLENAAIVTSLLRKFADTYNQDIPKFNEIFRMLQNTTEATRERMIAGLSPEDQKIAVEMMFFIDNIYGVGEYNKLMTSGIHVDEMVNSLKLVGQTKQADFFQNLGIATAEDAKDFWKNLELGEGDNAIEIMSKYYSAIQLSMIKPKLAEQLSHYFSHTADGLTRQEALKQGYKPIASENGLSKFLAAGEEPPLFHPEIVAKMQAMNHYLEYSRSFKSEYVQKAINKLDPIVGILKSSLTIWRPGHHVTSALGNAMFNTLAGVWEPRHYALAAKVMKSYKMIDDLDENAIAEIMKTNIPEGYVFKGMENGVKIALKDPQTGKIKDFLLDPDGIGKGATAVAGVRITPRRAKDVVENEFQQGTITGPLMKNPISKGIGATDQAFAKMAAARDNIFRYALFIKELEKGGPYASLEEAFQKAGAKVHEFHPTVGTLTAEERKVARRIFYFYTWQKQAFFKILDLMANTPAILTIPSKLQYAIAESQGLNPASFGQPFDPTQLFAAYNTNTVYGPQFQSEYGPIGYKPAQPQLDVIDSYLSQFQTKPGAGLWENIGNMATTGAMGAFGKTVTPALKIPAELLTGNKIGDTGKVGDPLQYIIDQTGFSALSRITGSTGLGERTDIQTGDYAEANKERQLINYLFGMKMTYYQSPAALDQARKERLEYFKRQIQNQE